MGKYRESRNLEQSIVEFLEGELTETPNNWDNVFVIKAFSQVHKKWTSDNPVICVNMFSPSSVRKEIGGKTFNNTYTMNIRIFGTDDGNRLDLSDFILNLLENDLDYYEYTVDGENISGEVKGKISILRITRNEKELINVENLAQSDKFRSIITFECHIVLS
jgi:hypothetical protein